MPLTHLSFVAVSCDAIKRIVAVVSFGLNFTIFPDFFPILEMKREGNLDGIKSIVNAFFLKQGKIRGYTYNKIGRAINAQVFYL